MDNFVVLMHFAYQQTFIVMDFLIVLMKVMKGTAHQLHVLTINFCVLVAAPMVHQNVLPKFNYVMAKKIARMVPMKKPLAVSFLNFMISYDSSSYNFRFFFQKQYYRVLL
jgi:hypothetical protein